MATIQGVYVALFGRPADPTGLAYFNGVTQNGANLNGIGDLASTQEYKDRFAGQNNTQIVNSIYQSLFGRDAETTGLNFFVDALNKGTLNIKNIAIAILDGAQGTDKTISANKVAAADLYTKAIDTPTEIGSYSGNTAAAQGRAFVTGVTTTVPTAAAVDTAVAAMVGAGAAGNTITATANITTLDLATGVGAVGDVKTTTNNNDTINAATFLQAGSKIDGGLGTDTVKADLSADLTLTNANFKNVEVLAVESTKVGGTVLDLGATDTTVALTSVIHDASISATATTALTVNNVALTTTVGTAGNLGVATTFAFKDAAGSSDTANLTLNASTGNVTIANIETLNVSNTGVSTVAALTADAAKAVNVSGAGEFTLNLANTNTVVETVSASSFTGKFAFNATAFDAIKSITGGAGADTITIDNVHTNDVTINTGAGSDTIIINGGAGATKALSVTGGDGADIFQIASNVSNVTANGADATKAVSELTKTLVTITDFNASSDAIKFLLGTGNRDTLLGAELDAIKNSADIRAAANTAATYTDLAKGSVFVFGGDAYLFTNQGGQGLDASDTLIKVTGVTDVASFTASNFSLTA